MRATRRVLRLHGMLVVSASVVLACWGLTACGGSPGASKLCAHARQVDGLTVTRVNSFPTNHVRFSFPAEVRVSDPVQARSVAQAVCELPAMPGGSMSCGSGAFTGWYLLTFVASGKRLPRVRIASDCGGEVHGLGQLRWVAGAPAFWGVLGTAMGLPHPDMTTFLAPASG